MRESTGSRMRSAVCGLRAMLGWPRRRRYRQERKREALVITVLKAFEVVTMGGRGSRVRRKRSGLKVGCWMLKVEAVWFGGGRAGCGIATVESRLRDLGAVREIREGKRERLDWGWDGDWDWDWEWD